METPVFVSENAYSHEAYNYEALKKKGIEFVQGLTGAFWTDYNEHDPGVTILEQLVYAMTDLAYRTGLPIQDLLYDINPSNKIFFEPAEILTVNPITLEDYRRVLIDELPELKNVWFVPIEEDRSTLKGLYDIIVDAQEYPEDTAVLYDRVRRVFTKYRTVCEDVEDIIIQKPIEFSLQAALEMQDTAEPEMVLAELYFRLNEYYNPEVKFTSLAQALEQGLKIDDLFSGPLLRHGFILDENLNERPTAVLHSDVSRVIMQIEGVASIKSLQLLVDGTPFDGAFNLNEDQSIRFSFPPLASGEAKKHYPISFLKGNYPYTSVDYRKAWRRYNELQAGNKRVYRPESYEFDTPKGQHWNLSEYYSIQNQFPMIYGVSEEGVPLPATTMRKAQAKQLKGYLMLFEQVFANYLAQVAHLKDIFSPRTRFQQTYFSQTLDAVPHVQDLYRQEISKDIRGSSFGEKKPIPADYRAGLRALVEEQDNYAERRNRFLDFFLAVHGETFEAYQLSQKPFYKNAQEYAKYQLESKTRFLGILSTLNKNRTSAMDYAAPDLTTNFRSGMEEKLIILLNLSNPKKEQREIYRLEGGTRNLPALTDDMSDREWTEATELAKFSLSDETVDEYFDYIDRNDMPDYSPLDAYVLEGCGFEDIPCYSTNFLREGGNVQGYLMGKNPEDGRYHIVFSEKKEYRHIASFDSEEKALIGLSQIETRLQQRNNEDETLYIIENILLRPDRSEAKFGFFLLDEEGNRILKSEKRYTFQRRKQVIERLERLEDFLGRDENFNVERKENGNFEIQFRAMVDGEEVLMRSIDDKMSVQRIYEIKEELFGFVSNERNIVAYKEKIAFYIQISDADEPIEEDFFHYQVSCVLPDWTNRLQNPQFRSVAENIIQENIPANTICTVHWLPLRDMRRFEELYTAWLAALQEHTQPKQIDENLKNELIRFLAKRYPNRIG